MSLSLSFGMAAAAWVADEGDFVVLMVVKVACSGARIVAEPVATICSTVRVGIFDIAE